MTDLGEMFIQNHKVIFDSATEPASTPERAKPVTPARTGTVQKKKAAEQQSAVRPANETPAPATPAAIPSGAVSVTTPAGDLSPLVLKSRPKIDYVDSELPYLVNMACKVAVEAGAPLYGRGVFLVKPVTLETKEHSHGVTRTEGATVLVPIGRAALVETLTSLIDWQKYDGRKDECRPISCPAKIAATIIDRCGDWPFPQIRAVVSAPTMRPDGSILNEPGFDHDTGILFSSRVAWPRVPDAPSLDDAKAALSLLVGLIKSFPFVSPIDRSAALAMILTALVRPCMPCAPMFGVSAPTPGTGKSKLVDIASVLATGKDASVMSAPGDDDEMEKRVGSALMAGDAFVTLDNIEHPLRSDFLCRVTTQSSAKVRILGKSEKVDLPTSATFCATGNSLRFVGDLARRVVLVNLDAKMERPEIRVFEKDAKDDAKARRVELVTAALTILRAFVVQRGPKIVPSLGGFEQWSDLIRSALMWIGEADPLSNAEKVRENDPERERTAAILSALPTGRDWTVSQIGKMLQQDLELGVDFRQHEGLADVLGEFTGKNGHLDVKRFGQFLRKQTGRIVDGRKIVSRGRDRTNVAIWTIEDEALSKSGAPASIDRQQGNSSLSIDW